MPVKVRIPVLVDLGSRIREARKARNWSQEDLAEEAGLDRSFVGGIERGERNISFTILCKVATALTVDVAALTSGLPTVQSTKPGKRKEPKHGA